MKKVFRAIKDFRIRVFRKLADKINRWASSTEENLILMMRAESDKLQKELLRIEIDRNEKFKELVEHFNGLYEDSEKEFMKNNKEISARYRKLNMKVEEQLEVATALVAKLNDTLERAYVVVSQIRGLIHERSLTIQAIQRATAFLSADLKTLSDMDTMLSEIKAMKEKIVRSDIHRLAERSSIQKPPYLTQ
jgi:alanyl-tRNA synthetase